MADELGLTMEGEDRPNTHESTRLEIDQSTLEVIDNFNPMPAQAQHTKCLLGHNPTPTRLSLLGSC